MHKQSSLSKYTLIFGLPILLLISLVALAQTSAFQVYQKELSIGISLDLLLTVPLVFFLLIRKTKIPKTVLVPITVLGLFIGYSIIPKENQQALDFFKNRVLPFVELAVLSFIVFKIRKTIKQYRLHKKAGFDFYTTLKNTCNELFPKMAAIPLISELAIVYYSIWAWKKRPLADHEFSYHKNSGTLTLLVALIGIIGIETFVLHLVLVKWNVTVAWIVTAVSIYTTIQIFGFLKSITKRPIAVQGNTLYLRYGIMGETTIPIQQIASITLSIKDLEQNKLHKKLSFLGDMEGHNVILKVKKPEVIHGIYGISKIYQVLAFYIDEPVRFKTFLDEKLNTDKV